MPTPQEFSDHAVSRRRFLGRAFLGCTALGTGALGYAHFIEPHWIAVERRSLPITNLPDALLGKRLVQISDIHVGETLDQQYIDGAISGLNNLNADLVVITGDFMTCHADEQVERTIDTMRLLPQAPLGVIAVLGNHDYGSGWTHKAVGDRLTRGLEDCNIRVLRNEVADVGGLRIVGVDDYWAGLCRPRRALSQLRAEEPALVLCHNPDAVDLPEWDNFQGWILAGHTHGGQCKPPWFDPPILPVRNKRYTLGEIALSGQRRLYINRGLGYVRRVRFNCPPEITVFTLERDLESSPA